ncbi:MAG: hypothetical protein ACI9VM_000200 [Candidatus Azotimanducaceae bacterium]|jgi:hypothetical protein
METRLSKFLKFVLFFIGITALFNILLGVSGFFIGFDMLSEKIGDPVWYLYFIFLMSLLIFWALFQVTKLKKNGAILLFVLIGVSLSGKLFLNLETLPTDLLLMSLPIPLIAIFIVGLSLYKDREIFT